MCSSFDPQANTEQQQDVEAKLQACEQFLHSIYDGIANSIFVVDVLEIENSGGRIQESEATNTTSSLLTSAYEFRFAGLNPAHERLTGLCAEDIKGKSPEQVLPPTEAAAVSANYTRCVQTRTTISYEECLPFQGEDTWWLTTLTPLFDSQQRIYRLTGTSINISDRKQAEQELTRQQEFLRNVIDTNPNLIGVKDWEGRFRLVNQALADIYGTTVENLIGKTDTDFNSHPAEVEHYLQDDRQVMSSLQPKFIPEETLTCPNGEIHYLQTIKKPLLSPDGQARHVLIVATDITARKRAEQERDYLFQQIEQQNQTLEVQVQQRTALLNRTNQQLLEEIRERQRLTAEIEQQARTMDTVLCASPDEIYMFDRAGRFLYVNRSGLQSMSLSLQSQQPLKLCDIVGKTGHELEFPLELMEPHEARLERVFLAGEPLTGEISYPYPNAIRHRDYIMTPLYTVDGSVEKVVVTSRDITERKQAEAALQESNQRIVNILESITDAFFALNQEWQFTYLNPQAEQLLQRTREELLGKNVWDEFPEAVNSTFYPEYHKAISDQVSVAFEDFYPPLNTWFEVHAYPTQDGLAVYFRDINRRKKAVEALRESEARFRRLFESNIIGVIFGDFNGTITDANDVFLQMVGYTREDLLLGKVRWDKITPQEYRHLDQWAIEQSQTTRVGSPWEKEYIRQDGSRVPVIIGYALLDGYDDRVIAFVLDISDRKRTEDQIKASLLEKETLLKEIHHRVKNNLQVISSLLRLQSRQIRDKQALELFQDSQNRVQAIALIHELLYKSPNLSGINVQDYIQTLVGNLCRAYHTHQRAITFNLNVEPVELTIDTAIPCGLIINELVSNTLKHAFPENRGGEICVHLLHSDPDHFILSISDNGIGLDSDFDLLNTSSLGLQLVYRLTKQLEGGIEVNQEQGTEFKIAFTSPNH
ncbi:MAG TPA: PAS domain S-box protein [Waterburya sp.]|jgi:PAS domain S-box-containing protein